MESSRINFHFKRSRANPLASWIKISTATIGLLTGSVTQIHVAHANTHELPRSLIKEALSEAVPSGIPPMDLSSADFELQWKAPIPGLTASLVTESVEWVRVAEVLLFP